MQELSSETAIRIAGLCPSDVRFEPSFFPSLPPHYVLGSDNMFNVRGQSPKSPLAFNLGSFSSHVNLLIESFKLRA